MSDTQAMGMMAGFGIIGLIFFLLMLIPVVFYFITLQGTMNKLSPANKPFEGALIWLSFIPLLGGIWYLVYVCMLSKAIEKDYSAVGQQNDGAMPLAIGLVVSTIACMIPFINLIAWIAVLVVWIMYWIRMAAYRKALPVAGSTTAVV